MSDSRGSGGSEEGSAATEFVLVMLVLLPLFLGIFQLGLFLHVRNTLTACAHEGARQAANYNGTLGEGQAVAEDCISDSLSPGMAGGTSTATGNAAGQLLMIVRVNATMPAIGFWGPRFQFVVSGHAVKEPTPA